MKITSIVKHRGSGIWYGFASMRGKNYQWFYARRRWLHVRKQDEVNSRAWMDIETPEGAKTAILTAIRGAV